MKPQVPKVLNTQLVTNQIVKVLFPFKPVAVPVDTDGVICSEEEAVGKHYATIVYDVKGDEFSVLEFSERTKHILASYKERHGRLQDLEILLSRWEDNKFRINIGNTNKHGLPDKMAAHLDVYSKFQQELLHKYVVIPGRKVHDIEVDSNGS
jgi:hypothetical protein